MYVQEKYFPFSFITSRSMCQIKQGYQTLPIVDSLWQQVQNCKVACTTVEEWVVNLCYLRTRYSKTNVHIIRVKEVSSIYPRQILPWRTNHLQSARRLCISEICRSIEQIPLVPPKRPPHPGHISLMAYYKFSINLMRFTASRVPKSSLSLLSAVRCHARARTLSTWS